PPSRDIVLVLVGYYNGKRNNTIIEPQTIRKEEALLPTPRGDTHGCRQECARLRQMSLRSILKPEMGGQQDFVFGAAQKLKEYYDPPLCPPPSWNLHGFDHHASAERSSGRAPDRLSHVPLRSRRVWNVTYSSGITKMPTALAAIIPVNT